jgi:agmatinase
MSIGTRVVFLGLEPERSSLERSRVLVLPIPYDQTSSYKAGSKDAPFEIIRSSHYVETWDEELNAEVADIGIHTLEPVEPDYTGPAATGELIYRRVREALAHVDKTLVCLGGEHGITYPVLRAFRERRPPDTVLHFDAHSDLRGSYEGTKLSHASVMRRVADDLKIPLVQVGIRAVSKEEADYIASRGNWPIFYAHDIARNGLPLEKIVAACGERVYISLDIDVFDSGTFPATGTPEPGGLSWYQVLDVVRAVASKRKIIGMDVNEVCPLPHDHASTFTAAKLVYKLIGYATHLRPEKKAPAPKPSAAPAKTVAKKIARPPARPAAKSKAKPRPKPKAKPKAKPRPKAGAKKKPARRRR